MNDLCFLCQRRPGAWLQVTIDHDRNSRLKIGIVDLPRASAQAAVSVEGRWLLPTVMDRAGWERFVAWVDRAKGAPGVVEIPDDYRRLHLEVCDCKRCYHKVHGPLTSLERAKGAVLRGNMKARSSQEQRAYRRARGVRWFTLRIRWRGELWDMILEAPEADAGLCRDLERAVEMVWEGTLGDWAGHWQLPGERIAVLERDGSTGDTEPLSTWVHEGAFGVEWIRSGVLRAVDGELRERLANDEEFFSDSGFADTQ